MYVYTRQYFFVRPRGARPTLPALRSRAYPYCVPTLCAFSLECLLIFVFSLCSVARERLFFLSSSLSCLLLLFSSPLFFPSSPLLFSSSSSLFSSLPLLFFFFSSSSLLIFPLFSFSSSLLFFSSLRYQVSGI